MRVNLYVVFDTVAQKSSPVNEADNDGVALRMYSQAVAKSEYADEMELYHVGSIDHESMVVTGNTPRLVEVNVESEVVDE